MRERDSTDGGSEAERRTGDKIVEELKSTYRTLESKTIEVSFSLSLPVCCEQSLFCLLLTD